MGRKFDLSLIGGFEDVVLIELKKGDTEADILAKLEEKFEGNPEVLAAVEDARNDMLGRGIDLDRVAAKKDCVAAFNLSTIK